MKRILHITGSMNRAGAETMLMNLYREIDRTEYQFDFVVFTNKKTDYEDEIISLGGRIYKINESNPLKRFKALKHLFITNEDYQIVHCHTNFSNALHLLAAKFAKVKKRIAHSHNTVDKSHNKTIRFFYHSISKFIINNVATHFVSCGQEASDLLFYKNKKVLLIPNSVDVTSLSNFENTHKNYVNEMFNLESTVLKLIQVGRFQNEKNHEFTIEIANLLKSKGVNFKMFFLGVGELEHILKNKVSELNLEKEVVFLGIRSDVPEFMAGSDILLMPSLYEGFPVVLVESQAVGIPSLISDLISREVDLGVGKIFFEDITKPQIWVDQINNVMNSKKISTIDRLDIITKKGFDTKSNVQFLLEFYNSN
ncbi:glycosyltransferase [Flavobacterium ponti]|uniref:Glycosyltransferase n=1 Tax=Flavobacterium ponti TaxID=665133 RepID=A0ABV9P1R3_9FLAO